MKIIIESRQYTQELLREHPARLFVFGDNMKRYGKRGQAVIRQEMNAYGVATKRYPSMEDWAFFSDKPDEFECVISDLRVLYKLSETYTIVFPEAGIGTGLADMKNRSPALWGKMNSILLEHFGYNNGEFE
jgi:hypothetical protein